MIENLTGSLINAVKNYKEELKQCENIKQGSPEAEHNIIEMLLARDYVQEKLDEIKSQTTEVSDIKAITNIYEDLKELDKKLKKNSKIITSSVNLYEWRERLNPPEKAWWWHFIGSMDHFDWIWNACAVVMLALSASFVINIYSAISVGEASIATTFSIIAQAAGLAAIGGGALSTHGQNKIKQILPKLGVSPTLFAEATFLASIILLAILFTSNTWLDNYYNKKGHKHYQAGELNASKQAYLRGLKVNPKNKQFDTDLGKVYESLGQLDQAVVYYQNSVENGTYSTLNDLGRAMINKINPITQKTDPQMAESILLLGLQRAQTQRADDLLMYRLRRNIGWSLLNQKKYIRAASYLEIAVKSDEKIGHTFPGSGMAYCFLAQVYEEQGDRKKAIPLWQKCIQTARPQFIHEYKWFTQVKQDRIAYCIDTRDVVSGYEGKRTDFANKICQELYDELGQEVNDPS